MDAAALAGLCALLARGVPATALPPGLSCPTTSQVQIARGTSALCAQVGSPMAREAIARVTFAEAGDQGDSGLAGVVYTILNRLQDGRWGADVERVLNARGQFEPVMRVGGDWRRLPPVSTAQQARVDTILNLALDGRLPDLTNGARYFQNPAIIATRARRGKVSSELIDFGGASASAQIGAHRFYVNLGRGSGGGAALAKARPGSPHGGLDVLIVGGETAPSSAPPASPETTPTRVAGDPSQALFIGRDGRVGADPP